MCGLHPVQGFSSKQGPASDHATLLWAEAPTAAAAMLLVVAAGNAVFY